MINNTLASADIIKTLIATLAERGVEGSVVANRAEAFEAVKGMVSRGASVMNGSSRTLEEIGFVDYLKTGAHGWNNLHANILAEADKEKRAALRAQAVLSDYYLGSVHAIAQTGDFLIASNSGSQLPHVVFTSPNLVFVVGAQKVVPTFADALRRVEEYVVPLEDARMKEVGMGGTMLSKLLVFKREPSFMSRKVRMIFVQEKLGF